MKSVIIITLCSIVTIILAQKCVPRSFGDESVVCVCNSTYCDTAKVEVPDAGQYIVYTSSLNGLRFAREILNFQRDVEDVDNTFYLNPSKTYQTVHGFGGAFTDSAGLNIKSLSNETQLKLLEAYFGKDGNNYNLGRVPVGGTDFSTHPYSLDDTENDSILRHFSLAREDYDYKIPFMQKAREINPELRFVAACWTAPPWMKTNNDYSGFLGFLKREYYQTFANYLTKFLEAYKAQNLPIWAISTGNEPSNVFFPFVSINDMGWIPSTVTEWVVNNFGPTVANSTSNETLILALDDQRYYLPWYIRHMFKSNAEIDKYISGIAIHWYGDQLVSAEVLDKTHSAFPNKFIINTEACTGSLPWEIHHVSLGSWRRAEKYIEDIIEDMEHWVTGWIDWNLALDRDGSPTYIRNYVDSPIIVNPEKDEFFKQPMYYAMAHFSKFIPRGSVRVALTESLTDAKSIAFVTPNNTVVIVLYNPKNDVENVAVEDPNNGYINIIIPSRSVNTIVYKQ